MGRISPNHFKAPTLFLQQKEHQTTSKQFWILWPILKHEFFDHELFGVPFLEKLLRWNIFRGFFSGKVSTFFFCNTTIFRIFNRSPFTSSISWRPCSSIGPSSPSFLDWFFWNKPPRFYIPQTCHTWNVWLLPPSHLQWNQNSMYWRKQGLDGWFLCQMKLEVLKFWFEGRYQGWDI